MDKMKRLAADDGGERRRTTSFNTDSAAANGGASAANSLKTSFLADGSKMIQVSATTQTGERCQMKYTENKVIGNGSFGVVTLAQLCDDAKTAVAIKKVLQDRRYKNRELQIMRQLSHCNVVSLLYFYYTASDRDEVYLNLVLEYVPETVYRVCRNYVKAKQSMPTIFIQLYTYQMYRSLAYIHSTGICHRDIKPQNLLVDHTTGVLKLCDFGSAKVLVKGEPNVSYICSRYYRAPELIFGATEYTTAIDIWSGACVMAELMTGQPLFPGDSGVDQLVEIIKVLGTPTREQILAMNKSYTEFKFPQIKANPWNRVFPNATEDGLALAAKTLCYEPGNRLTALQCCAHQFFDVLRDPNTRLPNGNPLPPLLNFTSEELAGVPEDLKTLLLGKK